MEIINGTEEAKLIYEIAGVMYADLSFNQKIGGHTFSLIRSTYKHMRDYQLPDILRELCNKAEKISINPEVEPLNLNRDLDLPKLLSDVCESLKELRRVWDIKFPDKMKKLLSDVDNKAWGLARANAEQHRQTFGPQKK